MSLPHDSRNHPDEPTAADWPGIFNAIPDAIIVTDSDFIVRHVNSRFYKLYGPLPSEGVGAKCFDLFTCDICHTDACPLTRILNGGESLACDGDHHCKSSPNLPTIITCAAYLDADGQVAGMVERIADASVIKHAEAELHRSHERLRKNMGAIIQAMSLTIEKRDPYTAGHQRRVAKLCRAIATEMGFAWGRIQGLRMAAAIHDLGKIHVPAAILNKSGEMSDPEMEILRQHPRTAYDILRRIQFPWPIAETIYQHHERMDGSGYPQGLSGDEILLEARILAVADVVESMSSFRPYRPAKTLETAVAELRNHRGSLYDARVVDICIALITERGFDFQTKFWLHGSEYARKKMD